ncbi:hypothetical protein HPP92_021055 [Vanilla planifolia]|uniref:Uncharacterized protein n=1 Tax=Vanilla planifolia TaxID=51239 RepID=A0A835UGU1_VANPL|nr:hypothetical protein HPP92_021055 [Vanilla planifolia]
MPSPSAASTSISQTKQPPSIRQTSHGTTMETCPFLLHTYRKLTMQENPPHGSTSGTKRLVTSATLTTTSSADENEDNDDGDDARESPPPTTIFRYAAFVQVTLPSASDTNAGDSSSSTLLLTSSPTPANIPASHVPDRLSTVTNVPTTLTARGATTPALSFLSHPVQKQVAVGTVSGNSSEQVGDTIAKAVPSFLSGVSGINGSVTTGKDPPSPSRLS